MLTVPSPVLSDGPQERRSAKPKAASERAENALLFI
jgi:hypothetical protein